jgi:hypothetical protein
MKRFLVILISIFPIALILNSCSKAKNENVDNNVNNIVTSGIKQVTRTVFYNKTPIDFTTYKFKYEFGRLIQITAIGPVYKDSMLFSYDSNNRLVQLRWNTENVTINYIYDKNGYIETTQDAQNVVKSYWHYNSQHQLISVSSSDSPSETMYFEWDSNCNVTGGDFMNYHYTAKYDDMKNPFTGFPEHPVFLTSIINIGAYFISPPTKNNVVYGTEVSGQSESNMTLEYEYNSNSLPVRLYEYDFYNGSQQQSVKYDFNY